MKKGQRKEAVFTIALAGRNEKKRKREDNE